jgi:hypothetical protein
MAAREITIYQLKHWSDRCAEDECVIGDNGVQRSKINK